MPSSALEPISTGTFICCRQRRLPTGCCGSTLPSTIGRMIVVAVHDRIAAEIAQRLERHGLELFSRGDARLLGLAQ